jgi:hypothetical protein
MNARFDELVTVLVKELDFHATLITAAFSMNEAITKRSLDGIQKAARCYDQCTCRIQELEEQRLQLSDVICSYPALTAGHASLSRVIDCAPPEQQQRLATLRASLKEAIGKLSKINYSNQILLTESLKIIAKMFDYIASQDKRNTGGYKRRGAKDRQRSTTAIVNTVA